MSLCTNAPEAGRIRLVYLLAASHSGSTLLALLLGSHPEIFTVGELKMTALGDPEHYLCSCRRRIRECPFWLRVGEAMRQRGIEFDVARAGTDLRTGATSYVQWLLRPLHRGRPLEALRDGLLALAPSWRTSLPRIKKRNAMLVQAIAECSGRRIIVDSSKIGLRLKYLLDIPDFDLRIIRLVRDGRAVALTYMDPARFADAKDPGLRGGGAGGDRSDERLPMRFAAREWLRSNQEAEAVLAHLDPAQWAMVRYEDLCRDPRRELARIFGFIGVKPELWQPDFRAGELHVIGNGMRLDTVNTVQIDERWKTELTARDIDVFNTVAGTLNRRLGYETA